MGRFSLRVTRATSKQPVKKNGHGRSASHIKVTQTVKEFFERSKDRRFQYQGYLGHGGQGIIFKLAYKSSSSRNTRQRMVVMKYGRDTRTFESEREALKVCLCNVTRSGKFSLVTNSLLRKKFIGCRHLGQIVTPERDVELPGETDGTYAHIFLEEIPNGTLLSFIERYRESNGGVPLPNRLLWRLFLCSESSTSLCTWYAQFSCMI
ncbi:hypothetical protein RRF57_013280 [Xylaria bambusicola]|uniref:Protein kinase domain-containing protein n=1 Tax=Xylaria bambusicola TaxID=326684 RepID=A0AAN7Z572_9PEZI